MRPFTHRKNLRGHQPSKKYYAHEADQEDLISIGTIGLIKGITTFDASKGARLATYAARCVENAIFTPTTLSGSTLHPGIRRPIWRVLGRLSGICISFPRHKVRCTG